MNYILYAIALLGVLMHLFTKVVSAQKKPDFSFKLFWSLNWFTFVFGIASAFTLVYIFIEPVFDLKEFDVWLVRPVAFVCGWFASSILKKLVDKVKSKIDKKLDDV